MVTLLTVVASTKLFELVISAVFGIAIGTVRTYTGLFVTNITT